jgi:hypothetical protein
MVQHGSLSTKQLRETHMLRERKMAPLLVAAAALACGSSAFAADQGEGGHVQVGLVGGTLGFGPEVGYRLNGLIGLRANGTFFNYSDDGDEDDYDYEGKLKLKSLGVMADIYPFGGSFRISVGARSNKNRVNAVVTPKQGTQIEIGDQEYDASEAGILVGEVNFKKFSPTVMLGWGGKLKGGLHFGVEAGLMFQGSPKASVYSQGSSLEGTPAYQQFLAELQQEVDEAEDDAKDFKAWPVLQLHLSYRF